VLILGIDPGPNTCGFAVIEQTAMQRTVGRYLEGGARPSDFEILDSLIHGFVLQGGNHVAIERVGLAHRPEAIHSLIETAHVAGICEGIARHRCPSVSLTPAVAWRRSLTGRNNASDANIKTALLARLSDVPRTNAHVRDAAGLALVSAWNLFTKKRTR
jgi:Holliday junction resolvasome RuvABC endonuclease subunit